MAWRIPPLAARYVRISRPLTLHVDREDGRLFVSIWFDLCNEAEKDLIMIIGVPTEVKDRENRVAATPGGVAEFVALGHRVLVERAAGLGSGFHRFRVRIGRSGAC